MLSDGKATVALVQTSCDSDSRVNLDKCVERIRDCARQGAQIIVTPELFQYRYFCQTADHAHFALAEAVPGPTTDLLCKIASCHEIVIVASLFERRAPGVFHSTAVVIDADGSLVGLYRKMHVPENAQSHEGFYFTPGDLGFRSFRTRYGTVGVLLGWDLYFPEAARITALQGAQIIVCPDASGCSPLVTEQEEQRNCSAWEAIQRSHAIANGIYFAVANRVGTEPSPTGHGAGPGVRFWGQSFIANHSGPVIAQASPSEEEIIIAECDFEKVQVRRTHWPFLRDRRIDEYKGLAARFDT